MPSVFLIFKGDLFIHRDHDIFIQGINQKRKVKLTFFSIERRRKIVRLCAPMYYSEGQTRGDDLARYYLWDFESGKGKRFLSLSPSRIMRIELAEEFFTVENFTYNDRKRRRKQKVSDS